jgi:hypothetical protein
VATVLQVILVIAVALLAIINIHLLVTGRHQSADVSGDVIRLLYLRVSELQQRATVLQSRALGRQLQPNLVIAAPLDRPTFQ